MDVERRYLIVYITFRGGSGHFESAVHNFLGVHVRIAEH